MTTLLADADKWAKGPKTLTVEELQALREKARSSLLRSFFIQPVLFSLPLLRACPHVPPAAKHGDGASASHAVVQSRLIQKFSSQFCL